MAATHYLTNRGKLLLGQGTWDDSAAGAIKMGLLSNGTGTVPVAIDTEAEIQDAATVTALLALANEECAVSGYARQALTRTNATQDDVNNRANLDASDVTFTTLAAGTTIYGGFLYDATTDTNDGTRQLLSVFTLATAIPTNGSNVTITIADAYRLV